MEQVILSAIPRTETGKSAARSLRKKGQIPALAYAGGSTPLHFSVDPVELLKLFRSKGKNTLAVLQSDDAALNNTTVMLRELQRNALNRTPIHVDFTIVDPQKPVQATIKLSYTGKAAGVALGGVTTIHHTTLRVTCIPALIPTDQTLDVSRLNLGQRLTAADLKLAEGVAPVGGDDLVLVSVSEG